MVRTIFTQPDDVATRHQHAVAVTELELRFPQAAALLAEACWEPLAFTPSTLIISARSGRPTRRSA